jgi:hypothetical protein
LTPVAALLTVRAAAQSAPFPIDSSKSIAFQTNDDRKSRAKDNLVPIPIGQFVQSAGFVDFFLLIWAAVHLNALAAEGSGFRTALYFLLLLPVQAYSLTTTLDRPSVFISNLIVNSMINLWLVLRSRSVLKKDPLAGYRRMVLSVMQDVRGLRARK